MAELILLGTAAIAGFIGSLLGLGGGIIIVPILTLAFHVNIRYAIAASLISIIATSSGAAAGYLKDHMTNLRLAVFLEIGTVTGAITGFWLATRLQADKLFLLFGFFLLFSAVMMFRKKGDAIATINHPWAESLQLDGYYPGANGQSVSYGVARAPLGLIIMYAAGILSALLGIGSGILKVLAMDGAMRVPMKVSSATSNFMIGVTATASAGAYLMRGDIRPEIAGPVALGIIGGSWGGSLVLPHISQGLLRKVFVVLLSIVAIQMIIKGI